MELYNWQAECLKTWAASNFRGIVNVATGAGKTVLALAAIPLLEGEVGRVSVKIIVPQNFLIRQWHNALISVSGVSRGEIGIYSGNHKSAHDRKYMIYVINSARYSFSRHMLEDPGPVLIIADECHHYGAEENSKIFDFARFADYSGVYYALGLSATPYSKNYLDVLVPFLGKEIYRFDFLQALEAGILCRFSLFNIALEFAPDERGAYDELSEKLSLSFQKLLKHCPQLYYNNSKNFFAQLDYIARNHRLQDVRELARLVSRLSFMRKEIVHTARARIRCVTELVHLLGGGPKIIIFGERIETADIIYGELNALMPGQAGVYHSGIHESVRKTRLRDFEDSRLRILVSCRTLDEGLDISDTDVGIVVSSTNSERQRIQRLGRVLRRKNDDKRARFYYLYVKDTMESEEVLRDVSNRLRDTVNVVDIEYDGFTGDFTNADYRRLTELAASDAVDMNWSEEQKAEYRRNVRLGSVSDDWLASPEHLAEKAAAAAARRVRNYYSAMLMLARARGNERADSEI
jgi:superfamily II DNA or RNA helicase